MQKLQAASKPPEALASEEILETLLVEAGAAGGLPTNEHKLLRYLGLEQLSFDFMHELQFLNSPQKPPGELRAALHLDEKVVATQTGMGEKRTRFSIFHEIAHCVLPEHFGKLFVDTDQTLSWWTKVRLEREANKFAADLLFQGKLFAEQSLNFDTSLSVVLQLSPKYGASYEASLRRYTESHVVPCALIVYEKATRDEESYVEEDLYRIQYMITSAPFRRLYFSSVDLSENKIRVSEIYSPHTFWSVGNVVEKEIIVEGRGRDKWRFEAEVFNNGYKIFQFLKRQLSASHK
jgi:Zn-dependent peptidase ImmA (M78 family)